MQEGKDKDFVCEKLDTYSESPSHSVYAHYSTHGRVGLRDGPDKNQLDSLIHGFFQERIILVLHYYSLLWLLMKFIKIDLSGSSLI